MKHRTPVLFEGTMFPEISVLANPDFVQNGPLRVIEEEVESQIAIECLNRTERRYVGELRVRTGVKRNANVPYKVDILCVTSLSIDPDVPEAQLEPLATQAAHAMAFPAVREMILTLTARQPWGQFSIGMSTLRSSKEQAEKQSPTKKRQRLKTNTSK